MIRHTLAPFTQTMVHFIYIINLWFNKLVHGPSKMTEKIIYLLLLSFPFISLSPFPPLLFSYPFICPSYWHNSPPFLLLLGIKQFHHPCSSIPLSLYVLPSFLPHPLPTLIPLPVLQKWHKIVLGFSQYATPSNGMP
jgi:hypothetical protein